MRITSSRLLITTLGVLGGLAAAPAMYAIDHPMIGDAAPAFELPSLDGATVKSAAYRGKHIVLHFGAGW